MKVIADFHLHSLHSRATSKQMNLEQLSKNAKLKGLNILGTGDITFPTWFRNLKQKLEPIEETGLFKYNNIFWILTGEVCTIFEFEKETKKVHHIIHVPSFDVAEQINEALTMYGNLGSDGRPTLMMNAPELVETIIEICKDAMITSAHLWTPWFSCLGSRSGFDSVEDCYQDQTKHIFSLETGLSSTPDMNWRLSTLDNFTLVSNSDSHSPYPNRIGREANILKLKKVTYWEIIDTIKKKDKNRFLMTTEFFPEEGKYHYDGHRNCNVMLHPREAIKMNNICPSCKRKLTVGVLHRVEELADRPEGFVPKDAIPFKRLVPLTEIIAGGLGIRQIFSKSVWVEYQKLIDNFENEFNVLLNIPVEELEKVTKKRVAEAIIKVRNGDIKILCGFDGEYGKVIFFPEEFKKLKRQKIKALEQKTLNDFRGPVV